MTSHFLSLRARPRVRTEVSPYVQSLDTRDRHPGKGAEVMIKARGMSPNESIDPGRAGEHQELRYKAKVGHRRTGGPEAEQSQEQAGRT